MKVSPFSAILGISPGTEKISEQSIEYSVLYNKTYNSNHLLSIDSMPGTVLSP